MGSSREIPFDPVSPIHMWLQLQSMDGGNPRIMNTGWLVVAIQRILFAERKLP